MLGSVALSGGDLKSSAEQRTKADRGGNFLRTNHRLRAECGVVVDDETFEIKTRPRQQTQANIVERDAAAKSAADGSGDSVSQGVNTWPEQKQDQHDERDRGYSAFGAKKSGAEKPPS